MRDTRSIRITHKALVSLVIFGVGVLASNAVFAQVGGEESLGVLDDMVQSYLDYARTWEDSISVAARWLFFALMGIDFVWMGIQSVMKRAEMEDYIAEVITRILTYGFFLLLLEQSPEWAGLIVDSMRELAADASGVNTNVISLSPSGIVQVGLAMAGQLFSQVSIFEFGIGDSLLLVVSGILLFLVFVAIAIELTLALVIVWVKIYGGQILLGLGSTKWTRDYAINYYKSALGSAFKLFVISLLVQAGVGSVQSWSDSFNDEITTVGALAIFAGLAVLWALIKSAGEITQSLFQGQASQSNAVDVANAMANTAHALQTSLTSTAQAGSGTFRAAGGATSAAMAAREVVNATNSGPSRLGTAMANAASKVGGEFSGRVAQTVGDKVTGLAQGAKVLGSSVVAEAMHRASGSASSGFASQYGSVLGDAGERMRSAASPQPNEVKKDVSG